MVLRVLVVYPHDHMANWELWLAVTVEHQEDLHIKGIYRVLTCAPSYYLDKYSKQNSHHVLAMYSLYS